MMLGNKGAAAECATVRYLGPAYYPTYCFELVFDKGKRETTTLRKVKQMDPPPPDMLVSADVISSLCDDLPDYWDLSVHSNMMSALRT